MAEYIEREAAKAELCDRCTDVVMCTRSDDDCPIKKGLNAIPAADVVERKKEDTMQYIRRIEAITIPVLPKEQRVPYSSTDEAFEEGWKTCQEYIATCIEGEDVISREAAIREVEGIYSPHGKAGTGDAISREVVLAKLRTLGKSGNGTAG